MILSFLASQLYLHENWFKVRQVSYVLLKHGLHGPFFGFYLDLTWRTAELPLMYEDMLLDVVCYLGWHLLH